MNIPQNKEMKLLQYDGIKLECAIMSSYTLNAVSSYTLNTEKQCELNKRVKISTRHRDMKFK